MGKIRDKQERERSRVRGLGEDNGERRVKITRQARNRGSRTDLKSSKLGLPIAVNLVDIVSFD